MYQSTKILDGFSCCFRQWKATDTHCSKLHGYSIEFKLTFESKDLDSRNWVVDFGLFSRSSFELDGMPIKQWFKYMFDHTTLMAQDDPLLPDVIKLQEKKFLQLRVLQDVGCEKFAEFIYSIVSLMISNDFKDSLHKPKLLSVECIENKKNTAIYYGRF